MNEQKIASDTGLTFDDVLLLPNYSSVRRQDIDLKTHLTSKTVLNLPFLSAPMDTVTESGLAIALGKLGGLGVIHRNFTIAAQARQITKVKEANLLSAAAVGVGEDLKERARALVESGVDVLLIDSAHGFSQAVIEATSFLAKNYRDIELISGSVATAAGANALIEAGAKCLRVGMGPGSICTTRIVSGMGVPQITAIMEAVKIAKEYGVKVIADGGLRYSGDIVKAIAAGADTVMSGSLFAGCLEAPGKVITQDGRKYKVYRGMGSVEAMQAGSAARYGQEYRQGQEKKLTAEGVEGKVKYQGTVEDVINQLTGGLRAGMYYTGVKNIRELQKKTRFIKITQASLIESHPHDVLLGTRN